MKVYEVITAKILDKLEEGIVPWHKPWVGGTQPLNLVSKKPYRGINTFMLSMAGYSSPYWASYKQIISLGGQVNKGEKGWPVVFWTWLDKTDNETGDITPRQIPFMRYYTAFNLDQTTGVDVKKIPSLNVKLSKAKIISECENIIKNMPKKPEIVFNEPRAYYNPVRDFVNMPDKKTFETSEAFYSTLFHELVHSTGHSTRLNRKTINEATYFGTESYSKEELVAEMGAAFLCGHCQIENKTINNSASYIKSWLKHLKEDKQMVILAAGQAQKASDFILNIKEKK